MYGVFQQCRHGRTDCGELLTLLGSILVYVNRQQRFLVEVPDYLVPDKWVKAVRDDTERAISYMRNRNQEVRDDLSARNQVMFSLIEVGTRELHRLCAVQATIAVRSLGYAFHVIPDLLRTPEEFSPKSYRFCFRVISAHWEELSLEMREAFCEIVGLKLESADTLIKSPGFSLHQFWCQSRSQEEGEIMIVDDDRWIEDGGQV
jgi:hypothetical protein